VVAGATTGIRVYFDNVWFDSQNKKVYASEKATRSYTVFVVLAHSVFTDYVVVNQELEAIVIESRIKELQDFWNDSGHLVNRWIEFIAKKQSETQKLQKQLHMVDSAIEYAQKKRAGEQPSKLQFGILNDAEKRIEDGEEPLDAIKSMLEDKDIEPEWTRPLDQLEQYRL
jgi:hypothetical protein